MPSLIEIRIIVSNYEVRVTADFYAEHILARASGLAHTVIQGGDAALAMDDEQF